MLGNLHQAENKVKLSVPEFQLIINDQYYFENYEQMYYCSLEYWKH
jgi:hypothetical protein